MTQGSYFLTASSDAVKLHKHLGTKEGVNRNTTKLEEN